MKLGYFTTWSVYHLKGPKSIRQIVIDGGYTHIAIAFIVIDDNGMPSWSDKHAAELILEELDGLDLKIGASIGGWNHRHRFKLIEANTTEFSKMVSNFIRQYSLDFIDLDWEFESPQEAKDSSWSQLVLELSKISQLSVSLQANIEILSALEVGKLSSVVSFWNLMAYNYSGPWSPVASHHSSLKQTMSVIDWLCDHVRSDRLNLGISAFGVCFAGCQGIGEAFSSATDVSYDQLDENFREIWDEEEQASYFQGNDRIISIETSRSIRTKTIFALDRHMGLAVWDVARLDPPTY